jgi:hypothetical protein
MKKTKPDVSGLNIFPGFPFQIGENIENSPCSAFILSQKVKYDDYTGMNIRYYSHKQRCCSDMKKWRR